MNSLLLIEQLDRIAWEAKEVPVSNDEDYKRRVRKVFELRGQLTEWHSQRLTTLNHVLLTLSENRESLNHVG